MNNTAETHGTDELTPAKSFHYFIVLIIFISPVEWDFHRPNRIRKLATWGIICQKINTKTQNAAIQSGGCEVSSESSNDKSLLRRLDKVWTGCSLEGDSPFSFAATSTEEALFSDANNTSSTDLLLQYNASCKAVLPLAFVTSLDALLSSSNFAHSAWLYLAQMCNGVCPLYSSEGETL